MPSFTFTRLADTQTLFTNLSHNINKRHYGYAATPPLRNHALIQLEKITRKLATAFQEVHQLCLDEIERNSLPQQTD